ncbi:MAG: hypothetical protein NTV15_00770, partial [Candidatus Bathyarchaeota archaeon]|nr:hypothetical protein [Candidatus Bathyarchaeota archaeon]
LQSYFTGSWKEHKGEFFNSKPEQEPDTEDVEADTVQADPKQPEPAKQSSTPIQPKVNGRFKFDPAEFPEWEEDLITYLADPTEAVEHYDSDQYDSREDFLSTIQDFQLQYQDQKREYEKLRMVEADTEEVESKTPQPDPTPASTLSEAETAELEDLIIKQKRFIFWEEEIIEYQSRKELNEIDDYDYSETRHKTAKNYSKFMENLITIYPEAKVEYKKIVERIAELSR